MAVILIATPDPPPSTRVIIRRVRPPHDTRRVPKPPSEPALAARPC